MFKLQLLRLLESLECHMIGEVRKRVSKELTLAVAERAREEEALPTDLWKRAVRLFVPYFLSFFLSSMVWLQSWTVYSSQVAA